MNVNNPSVSKYPFMYLAVFVFGAAINQYYSYLGYMPLDQAMIYNGAWRVLAGQAPLIDFWTPYGLIPILVQATIFRGLGVSWTTYALHASLLNGFFGACAMFAGLRLGLSLTVAAMFGVIAGLIAYPPMATPFPDNHAAIFSSLLVLAVVLGIVNAEKRRMWWLLALPLGTAAFLSKQSPTIFLIAFGAMALLSTAWLDRSPRDLVYVIAASVLCLLVTVLIFRASGITWELFWIEQVDPALAIAEERIISAGGLIGLVSRCCFLLLRTRIGHVPVFLLPGLLIFFSTFVAIRNRKAMPLILLLCAAGCFMAFLLFTAMTNNQPASGLALLAVVFVLSQAACVQLFAGSEILFPISALPAVVACAIQVGWTEPRFLNDFYGTPLTGYTDAALISPQLAHLRWMTPPDYPGESRVDHYRDLMAELARRSGPTVFLSDSMLDPLIGQKPVAPALFWHSKLSFPVEGRARELFDRQFKRDILESGSDLIVLDGTETWMNVKIQDFPWLNACLRKDQTRQIGRFSLVPLDVTCVQTSL
jgi:hypothetical protein